MKISEAILENTVSRLLKMCEIELELESLPKIDFVDEILGDGTSFGEFTGDAVRISITNRHPMDVLRTLVHELVHWKQSLENKDLDGSDGSDTENEANAIAGIIMRRFGKANPECFTL